MNYIMDMSTSSSPADYRAIRTERYSSKFEDFAVQISGSCGILLLIVLFWGSLHSRYTYRNSEGLSFLFDFCLSVLYFKKLVMDY